MILANHGIVSSSGGGVPLLLDTYSGAAAAYSLRKLNTSYTGNAITIRRSSDNASQNIGFDLNGNLDTASMLSFVGAGNGFVSIWYDQSGNGKNAEQVTSSLQPRIVNSGVLDTKNSKPIITFNNNYKLTIPSSNSYFIPLHNGLQKTFAISSFYTNVLSGKVIFGNNGGSTNTVGSAIGLNAAGGLFDYITNTGTPEASNNLSSVSIINTNTLYLFSLEWDLSNGTAINRSKIYKNNGFAFQNNIKNGTPSNAVSAFDMMIGGIGTSSNLFDGGINEIIIYFSDQNANRTGISDNINSFYSIY